MNTRIISLVFGVTFIAVGILGFIPNPLISNQGLFAVNAVHNVVHLILGCSFIFGALKFPGNENRLLIIMGLGGIAVTIVGLLSPGDMMLGIIHANDADHWLHFGLTTIILASGLFFNNANHDLTGHCV